MSTESVVFTLGHSTRPLDEFIAMLKSHAIERLVDVRKVPRSRTNPQFDRETLPASLADAGIEYEHAPGLGGFRRTHEGSVNTGWRNLSFRGYADFMQTPEFEAELARILVEARRKRTALMCAEAVPWRCHRSLIADALVVRGFRVEDISSATRTQVHELPSFAVVRGTSVTYPASE